MTGKLELNPKMKEAFSNIAEHISKQVGTAGAFLIALAVVIAWGITGPIFGFSDTWQLVINTGTTIVTFLMVFLIQNTQNRQGLALQLKLDELIKASKASRNELVDIEDLSEKELEQLEEQFRRFRQKQKPDKQ